MKYSAALALAALSSLTLAQIDPKTVTSLSPEQSLAFASAEQEYVASLTSGSAFESLVQGLATDPAALGPFTSAAGIILNGGLSGSEALSVASAALSALPSDVGGFFSSIVDDQVSIVSSIVNDPQYATETGSAQGTGSGSSGAAATGSAAGGSSSGSAAAPTAAVVKAAGVAVGVFGAAVALL